MKTERVKISDLKAPPRNVRKHNSKQITEFKRSLTMFGQIRPVVIDEEGVIWCGNGLVEAARELAWETVDVYRLSGLSVKQKHKLMITDNRIYSLGFDDYDSINKIIEEIGDSEMFGRSTRKRRELEDNRDYRKLCYDLLKNPGDLVDTPHKKKMFDNYRKQFMKWSWCFTDKIFKTFYEGLYIGDPKERKLRAILNSVAIEGAKKR